MPRQNTRIPRSAFKPYPELVDTKPHTGPWEVENSNDHHWLPTNGATDKLGRKIFVPLEEGADGVALHELSHVRWSPDRFPRVDFPLIFLQAVEDARINLGLREIGFPFRLDREQRAHVAHLASKDVKSGQWAAMVMRAVASLGTDAAEVQQAEIDALPPAAAEIADRWVRRTEERLLAARARVGGPVAPFRVAHRIAEEMAADFAARGLIGDDFEAHGVGCCHVIGAIEAESGSPFGDDRLDRFERMLARRSRREPSREIPPGHMRIARPPLTQRQPRVLRGGANASRCRTEGARITRPDRLMIDRAIFGRAASGGGGTVLVDTSGSMSITEEEVEEIVRAAGGAAVVALYSGSGDEGELRIVADGARRAASDQFRSYGAGNVIDLPALEWLARRPAPRLWISDFCVTGVGDKGCETLLAACRSVVERHGIQRVDDAAGALEVLG